VCEDYVEISDAFVTPAGHITWVLVATLHCAKHASIRLSQLGLLYELGSCCSCLEETIWDKHLET